MNCAEAITVLECMAIDLVGVLPQNGAQSALLVRRIEAIDLAQEALRYVDEGTGGI